MCSLWLVPYSNTDTVTMKSICAGFTKIHVKISSLTGDPRAQLNYRDSVTRFFASGFFHESSSPKPHFDNFDFFENLWRYSQVKEHHQYQRHRWQTLPPVPQRCPNKIIKTFLIEDFSICHRCQGHRWWTWSCKYLREFSKKCRNSPTGILRSLGETDSWKNLKSKISWHCIWNTDSLPPKSGKKGTVSWKPTWMCFLTLTMLKSARMFRCMSCTFLTCTLRPDAFRNLQ